MNAAAVLAVPIWLGSPGCRQPGAVRCPSGAAPYLGQVTHVLRASFTNAKLGYVVRLVSAEVSSAR